MDIAILIFLSSGLFLGWSLGSNDAANIFGTAVSSRMVRFGTAAVICAVFVVLGAVIGGAGAAHGLGKLGAVNALAGSFMVALAAALTVYGMTRLGLPVSTTQAVVGGIVGWNLFGGFVTDMNTLLRIVGTWIAAPILGALFAIVIYKATVALIHWAKVHLVALDALTRIALVVTGAFGAYSLGANNIGNVMGVFIPSSPFQDIDVGGWFTLSSIQQLFLLGGLAIAVGVFYSKRVMMTVGDSIIPVSPIGAWVVVLAQSLVLFIFSSTELVNFVVSLGLPPYPLVPVSSSQAVIGAVIGVGLTHGFAGASQIKWKALVNIMSGWVTTPIIACVISFLGLFFLQNVFQQQVYQEIRLTMSDPVAERLEKAGIDTAPLQPIKDRAFTSAVTFRDAVRELTSLEEDEESLILQSAEIFETEVTPEKVRALDRDYLGPERSAALETLEGQSYDHRWQLEDALGQADDAWQALEPTQTNNDDNKQRDEMLDYIFGELARAGEP